MGRIRVLSDNVANKIAAGEVVERPASVVKELLENSLDAGATEVRIDAEAGGRRLIRVVDNGSGMLRDDALLAFERHATSKLSEVRDLESIATLGFRGEALPSIASVSRLVLETRSPEETTGTRVEIAGGKILNCTETGQAGGTTITVRDLFFNVPARKKFLRSEPTELAHVASLVTHYSLAHPERAFSLSHGGKDLLAVTPVESIRERVFQVFGGQTLDELVDLGAREKEILVPAAPGDDEEAGTPRVFLLRGFVSRPQVQKMNRNSIFLFVNRRLIKDRLLMHAISSAYHNLIPPSTYPFALLFLDCDAAEVDVNVHPSKTEVRFRHGTVVHDFVRDAIREALIESRPISSLPGRPASPGQAGARLPYSEFTKAIENQRFEEVRSAPPMPAADEQLPEFILRQPKAPDPRFDFGGSAIPVGRTETEAPPAVLRLRVPDTHGEFPAGFAEEPSLVQAPLGELRPMGQLQESFIVAAGPDGLWIIDQHVAHERILFEHQLAAQAAGRVEQQRLLMPIVLELTPAQQIEYDRLAHDLALAGFETEPFGNRTIAVQAAPVGIGAGDIERVIHEILEIAEGELRRVSFDDVRRGIAASIACRAAIKINMRLDQTKMEWLLRELAKTACPMSCPHGRPIALRYSTREILRAFHRI